VFGVIAQVDKGNKNLIITDAGVSIVSIFSMDVNVID
jgi:hypothetical protein